MLQKLRRGGLPAGARWVLSTDANAWWDSTKVLDFLAATEASKLYTTAKGPRPALVGAVQAAFMLINAAMLEYLGDPAFVDGCRHELLRCPEDWERPGCRTIFKLRAGPRRCGNMF